MLPKHEEIRNRREREFQSRLLAAAEKQKANWLWTIVNSRLFSVIVLGTLGALISVYISHRQECLRDFHKHVELFESLTEELTSRLDFVYSNSSGEFTATALIKAIRDAPHVSADLRQYSLSEVQAKYYRTRNRFDFRRTPEDRQIIGVDSLLSRHRHVTDNEVPNLRLRILESVTDLLIQQLIIEFEPYCGPRHIFSSLFWWSSGSKIGRFHEVSASTK